MDFEKMLQDDMDLVAKRVEDGLENNTVQTIMSIEELEKIVRSVVKEEIAVAVRDIKGTVEKTIRECLNSVSGNSVMQSSASNNSHRPNIERVQKVTYDILKEARYGGMTCGGWTFFANDKEGRHLWAVNFDGSEYCELYPKTISRVHKIEDGYVYFRDADYKDFRVCISSGKVERVKH